MSNHLPRLERDVRMLSVEGEAYWLCVSLAAKLVCLST